MFPRGRRREDVGRRQRLVELFHRIDTNHDRILSRQEVTKFFQQNCYDETAVMGFWRTFDLNRDCQITAEEYNRVLARLPDDSVDSDRLRRVFSLFDTDNSGRLELTEIQAVLAQLALPANEETLRSLFALNGISLDCGISFDDFLQIFSDPTFV